MSRAPAVFLDRDDTLNENDTLPPPANPHPLYKHGDLCQPDRVVILPGAIEACTRLKRAGFKLIVFTNQGGVARGNATIEDVEATNARLQELMPDPEGGSLIDACYFSPYHPEGRVPEFAIEHHTRKPNPGMLLQASQDHDIDLRRSWAVGDKARDVDAGIAAGIDPARCLLIGKNAEIPDLAAAADRILAAL